jgi:hypothetical protein
VDDVDLYGVPLQVASVLTPRFDKNVESEMGWSQRGGLGCGLRCHRKKSEQIKYFASVAYPAL